MTPFQRWLDQFPSTNAKQVAFLALVAITFANDAALSWSIVTWAMRNAGQPDLRIPSLVNEIHDAWLIFLAAFGGLSLGQFWAKRKSFGQVAGEPGPTPDSVRSDTPTVVHEGTHLEPAPPPLPSAPAPSPMPPVQPVLGLTDWDESGGPEHQPLEDDAHAADVMGLRLGLAATGEDVIAKPSPNYNARPLGVVVSVLVVHADASGSLTATLSWLRNTLSRVSYHECVGRTGNVVAVVAWSRRAWHAGKGAFGGIFDVNSASLGLCLSNRQDGNEPFPEAQLAAGAKVAARMLVKYPHITRDRIVTHTMVALPKGRKSDPYPGEPTFDLDAFRDRVLALLPADDPRRAACRN